MLNSFVFADAGGSEEEEEDAVVGTTDARFAVMSIIGFIPYFNWLSWVFAWMDTSKRRYAVYAIVYLAPYLRSNLSLSPDESWLPIVSIVLCIIHIQIEASIQSGDLDSFAFFGEAVRQFSPAARRKDRRAHHERSEQDHIHLPSAQERLRDEIRKFGMPEKPFRDPEHKNPNVDADDE